MSTERFNRQFILLDFEDLDNPEFMEFVRSPEFSTYLIMRRYIWRSEKPHTMGLHEYYAQGLLACSIEREKIAEALGGVTIATVSKDITALVKRQVIRAIRTGRQNIYILGKWAIDAEDDVYYEYFFLDRLQGRLDRSVQADEPPNPTGGNRPGRLNRPNTRHQENLTSDVRRKENLMSDVNPRQTSRKVDVRRKGNVQADVKNPSHNNIEWNNREKNREVSKASTSLSQQTADLHSPWIENIIETCSKEFRDIDHLSSNISRAYNLWARTDLDEEGFANKLQEARRITKGRISLSAVHDRGKKMAYFFAVLEDVLGLR